MPSGPRYLILDIRSKGRTTVSSKCCWATAFGGIYTNVLGDAYSTGFKQIEKINATAPQPQRTVLK